jgi:MerR family transcriptional regulator, light-induced transcriptional regulator
MSKPKDKIDPPNSSTDSCWRLVSRIPGKYGDIPDAPGDAPAHGYQGAQMSLLVNAIESEIIPRLMANHGGGIVAEPAAPRLSVPQAEVQSFTRIALSSDSASCHNFVESLRMRGVSLRSIYLELLGPSARELDGMWARDECDFTEITVALWRIQQIMYDLSPEFQNSGDLQKHGKNNQIMLVPVPGSQHTLGILMVAEFFRKAGWRVWGEPLSQAADMIHAVGQHHFDVFGISIGSEPQLEGVDDLIIELRKASQNPSLIIMAGGPVFVHHPEYAKSIGADICAMDAEDAVRAAEKAVNANVSMQAKFFERGS